MFSILEIISYVLILISAIFMGIALMHLSNKKRDFAISKKLYIRFSIICYLFLVPGVLLWIYVTFF